MLKNAAIRLCTISLIIFSFVAITANAQNYGGSAHVTVKDKSGNYRVINVVSDNPLYNPQTSISDAKNALLAKLQQYVAYDEEMVDNTYYSVDKLTSDTYKGQASVRVKNKSGNRRVITVVTSDYASDKTLLGRKRELLQKLNSEKNYDEEFIDAVNYDLN